LPQKRADSTLSTLRRVLLPVGRLSGSDPRLRDLGLPAEEVGALLDTAEAAEDAHAVIARVDFDAFVEFVMEDEDPARKGVPVRQAPMHLAWTGLMNEHPRLVILAHIESGKSTQISVARTLFDLGRNPNLRCIIVSNTQEQAKKIGRVIRRYIEKSARLHRVFPRLRKSLPWGETSFTIERTVLAKEPSVQVIGVRGDVLGSRTDRLVMDDVLRFENTRTKEQLKDLVRWYDSTLEGRLTESARVRVVGTPWDLEDILHVLAARASFKGVAYPVRDPATNELRWPERWSDDRIRKKEVDLGPLEAGRQLYVQARDDSAARFRRDWIDACLKRGEGLRLSQGLQVVPPGCAVYVGVDLGVGQNEEHDLTALCVIMVMPNEDRRVLAIKSGHWTGPQIIEWLIEFNRLFLPTSIMVENNAGQDYILQFARAATALPVFPFTTGRNKAHPEFGVESLAIELSNKKWIIPCQGGIDPEVAAWTQEMLYYAPPPAHTGDRLMACVAPGHLVTTARGLVPIEEVQEGDLVLTHMSRWRKVTGTTSRAWAGMAVALKPRGMRALVVTPEHPVWSSPSRFERASRTNRLIPSEWAFRDASELRVGRKTLGDFVLAPAASWPQSAPEVDPGLAFLAGLYLAEGWTSDHQASFAFNRSEDYLVELVRREALRLWGAKTSAYTKEGHGGVTACIQSTAATRFFERFGKRGGKCLPWEWMALPVDSGLLIARGWLVGDGSVSHTASGAAHLRGVSVSRALVYQMQQFLWRAGLLPSVSPFAQPLTFRGKPCGHLPAQSLSLSEADTARILAEPLPEEARRWGTGWRGRERTNSCSVPVDGGAAVKIASLERFAYDGRVYNLHVEEDESFVVEGIAVHNSWFAREAARRGANKVRTFLTTISRR
jgi:hypothetical protein